MNIARKYGLLITLGVVAWVIVTHLLIPNPASPVHTVGAGIFFNLLEIAGIFLGIKARRDESPGGLSFKTGVKTGVSIAFVYAISASLFFLATLVVFGTKMMASEPGAENKPVWQVVLGAFAGLFIFAILFGLVYSTLISFVLAKRRSSDADFSRRE